MKRPSLTRKACQVAVRHKRIYHGCHVGAHLGYLGICIYEGHSLAVMAVGMVTLVTLWGVMKEMAQEGTGATIRRMAHGEQLAHISHCAETNHNRELTNEKR